MITSYEHEARASVFSKHWVLHTRSRFVLVFKGAVIGRLILAARHRSSFPIFLRPHPNQFTELNCVNRGPLGRRFTAENGRLSLRSGTKKRKISNLLTCSLRSVH